MDSKSKKPNKQRKKIYVGAIHTKRKQLVAPIDKKIRDEINKKRISIRKGDTVKIIVGKNKGKTGKVERIDYKNAKVYIKDIKIKNARGQEKFVPFNASNLLLTSLDLNDSRRIKDKTVLQKNKVK